MARRKDAGRRGSFLQVDVRSGAESLERRVMLAAAQVELFDAKPAVFVENQGQWSDSSVYYAYNSGSASIAFGDDGLRFRLTKSDAAAADPTAPGGVPTVPPVTESTSFSMQFVGASRVTPQGEQKAEGVYNYFVGDQANWRSNVPGYETVSYDNLYDGVTLKTLGQHGSMKYEFHVAAGGDYQQVQIRYNGIQGLAITNDGSLHVQTSLGEIVDEAPVIYQEIGGKRVEVAGRFVRLDESTYGFELTGQWDSRYELVLDPELAWSSYLGGSDSDYGYGIAMDGGGNAWVTGMTYSTDWASGGFDTSYNGGLDTFVAKISAGGTLAWSSYLGGSGNEYCDAIAVDGSGNAWVTGQTYSSGWASGGFDTSLDGGSDAFVAKISTNGTLAWSSYLGGSGDDRGYGIAVDGDGNAWVAGQTSSSGWSSGGFDTSFNGSYDAFVAKINANGTLAWSSYLGGSGDDCGYGIAADRSGNAWVTGYTESSGWTSGGLGTSLSGPRDAFVAKINAEGALAWSTYLGAPVMTAAVASP